MRYLPASPLTLLCFLALAACADREGPIAPHSAAGPTRQAPRLAVKASDPRLRTLVVEVDGAGSAKDPLLAELLLLGTEREQPLLYNIQLSDGYSDAPLRVLAGPGRRVVVRGHDEAGELTHQGEGYLGEVLEGEKSAPLSLALQPVGEGEKNEAYVTMQVVGQAPREATIVVRPKELTLAVGDRVELRAEVLDREGRPIPLGPGDIQWAVDDPRGGLLRLTDDERQEALLEARRGLNLRLHAHYYGTHYHVAVTIVDRWVAIAAGQWHTCALRASGAAYCWGANGNGELGDGTTTGRLTPVPVTGNLAFQSIDAGHGHTCGVTTGGDAYCWGLGLHNQLGGLGISNPPGGAFTCATTTAQRAQCEGPNWVGQLGDRTLQWRYQLVDVSTSLPFVSVSAGRTHTCALSPQPGTAAGSVYCWGGNLWAELGNNDSISSPWCGTTFDGVPYCAAPELVYGANSYKQVDAGDLHTCAITTADDAQCWGVSEQFRLGGHEPGRCFAKGPVSSLTGYCVVPVTVVGGLKWSRVSAGGEHSCAITRDGLSIYCWGRGSEGQRGDGTRWPAYNPVRVATPN